MDIGINYLAVGLAALSAFFLGFVWYTIIFAKAWQKLIGMGDKGTGAAASASQTPNLGRLLVGSFILEIFMAFVLALLIGMGMESGGVSFLGIQADWAFGLGVGLLTGFGLVGLALGVNYLFEGKPLKLWLIDAGYNIVVFGVMGAIIGAM